MQPAQPVYLCTAVLMENARICREVCVRREHRARSLRGPGIIETNEQAACPPLPRDRHPSAGHPLPDLPAHRRVPARHPHRGPDRALPPRPSRSTRPRIPRADRGDPALTLRSCRRRRRQDQAAPLSLGRTRRSVADDAAEPNSGRECKLPPLCMFAIVRCGLSGAAQIMLFWRPGGALASSGRAGGQRGCLPESGEEIP